MSYVGQVAVIPLGDLGLQTDAPMTSLPPSALIKANNISLYSGKLEKSKGSLKYSETSLPNEVVSVIDWWPDSATQRLIALTSQGEVFRDTGDGTWSSMTTLPSLEVQRFTANYPPVSGGIRLNFNGNNTAVISSTATQAQIQTAIQALPGLSSALVQGDFQTGFRVLLRGTVGDQPMFTSNTNTFVGRNSQLITFSATPTAGNWVIGFDNGTTVIYSSQIPFNASDYTVQLALRAMDESFESVTVSGNYSSGFTVLLKNMAAPPVLLTQSQGLVASSTPVTITVTPNGAVVLTISEESKGKTSLGVCTTDAHMVQGGQEESGRNKKLFIFSGSSQIQILEGDGTTTRDISYPSPDWANGNYPTYGIIYAGRLCVFGCPLNPHQTYFSLTTDHENFLGEVNPYPPPTYIESPPTFPIFPGEADRLCTAIVYRGVLFLLKKPFGAYVLDGQDPSVANWQVRKFSDSFGVLSPHSALQIIGDTVIANSSGSYTSLSATDAYSGFNASDILSSSLVEEYVRDVFNPNGLEKISCLYYPEKKVAYFTGQSSIDDTRDLMLVLDVKRQVARFSVDTKERANCLALRRDGQKIQRPIYGDKQGFVWLMDQDGYYKDTAPYVGDFQTAYTDLGIGNQNKIFDFLEVNYVATGNNNFFVDVYVDGEIRQTITFNQRYGAVLDSFILDQDRLVGDAGTSRNRKQLRSCFGNRISFRFYNGNFNEGFKIERVIVSFRPSDEQVIKGQI
jgi:hypothetical protein